MKSAVPMLLILALPRTSGEESSDVYLRNVVEELQILNGVVPSDRSTRVSYEKLAPSDTSIEDTDNQQQPSQQHYQTLPKDPTYLLEPPPLQESAAAAAPPPPPPPPPPSPQPRPQPAPMILGFTASELASMYRKAMERGVPVKHRHPLYQQHQSPVAEYSFNRPQVVAEYSFEQRPKVVPALRVQQPTGYGNDYAYYFYPLHSFRHELEKQNNGYHPAVSEYHTLPDSAYAATTMVDPGKKETSGTSLMSHIITGVSSFVGMAIFFFFSMFIYPRFLHMMHFPFVSTSRTNFRDELANVAAFVTEAIDAYNQNTRQKSKHLPQR